MYQFCVSIWLTGYLPALQWGGGAGIVYLPDSMVSPLVVEYSRGWNMFEGWGMKFQVARLLAGGYVHWMEYRRIVPFLCFFLVLFVNSGIMWVFVIFVRYL